MTTTAAPLNVQVWGVPFSTCTQRILFTCAELGIPMQLHNVELMKGAHKDPAYMQAHQPFGKIPAADINGQPFYESRAIARVIAEFAPANGLLPRDLAHRALVEQWASLEFGTYNEPMSGIVYERIFKAMMTKDKTDEKAVKKMHGDSANSWQVLDAQLAGKEYLAGQFSLADIFMAPYFQLFSTLPEGQEVLKQYPNIAAWWQRLSNRPAWQKCVADAQASMGGGK